MAQPVDQKNATKTLKRKRDSVRPGILTHKGLMRSIGVERLRTLHELEEDDNKKAQCLKLEEEICTDAIEHINKFLFFVKSPPLFGENWFDDHKDKDVFVFRESFDSVVNAHASIERWLLAWSKSDRRRTYSKRVLDPATDGFLLLDKEPQDGIKNRVQLTQAWLLEGPLHIPDLCDIVKAFGMEFEGRCIKILEGHKTPVTFLTAHSDGRLTSADNNSVRTWDQDGICIRKIDYLDENICDNIWSLCVTSDGILFLGHADSTVSVWEDQKCVGTFGCSATVRAMCELPNRMIALAEGAIICVSARDENSLESDSEQSDPDGYVHPQDNSEVNLIEPQDDSPIVWEAPFWGYSLFGHKFCVNVLVSMPPNKLASASDDGSVRVWNTKTRECLLTMLPDDPKCMEVVSLITLPGDRMASGSGDHTVRIWDGLTGDCLMTLKGHTRWVWSLALLPDGNLASGGGDQEIRVWDIRSGTCVQRFDALIERYSVRGLVVRSDGKLVSCGGDTTLRVWE
jgi:WD40 repeat protein